MGMIEINFDGKMIEAEADQTVLQLAESQGVEIPTLCHDNRLEPFGSCFVCVVEVKGARTLLPACATKLRPGMEIVTNSEQVRASRRTALELLLSNHYGDCYGPCQLACPARCDAQGYTGLIAAGRYEDALKVVKQTVPFPASIGRVCPKFCEDVCRRDSVEEPIGIGYLKRFIADLDLAKDEPYMPPVKEKIGKKVAVIGGGPGGLASAYYLTQEGVDVEVFESKPILGGMLYYGIPPYRLPKDVLAKEIATITGLGMQINYNKTLGKDFTIEGLKKDGYDAVVLAIGAWKASKLRVPNDDAPRVLDGIEFMDNIATDRDAVKISGRVAVVGGGNTAFDCARSAVRLGADEVVMVYRRTRKEMPANEVEKDEAEEEGVKFMLLTAPTEVVVENGQAAGLVCQKMELGEPDASGRRRPVPVEGSEFTEKFDYIITAIGQGPDIDVLGEVKDKITDGRWIKYDEATGQTAEDYLFIAGDCATGAATVVEALAGGRKAAQAITQFVQGKEITVKKEFISKKEDLAPLTEEYFDNWEKDPRKKIAIVEPETRKHTFNEIESAYPEEVAKAEADRCLECGCMDVFECKLKEYATDYEAEVRFKGEVNFVSEDDSHPYILREPEKCVLCGRCVRLCNDKVSIGVFGYVDRGFNAQVSPEFRGPLSDSDCIACGVCISGCPVGALNPKTPEIKSVPVEGEKVEASCYHCSIGCNVTIETLTDSIHNIYLRGNYLCEKGRFKFPALIPAAAEADYSALSEFKDALVYPSPSLSSEDYEALKAAAGGMNWQIANYYSQGSLWQAFAAKGALPAMDFFRTELEENALVVLAGDVEGLNPTALHRLADIIKPSTSIVQLGGELGLRMKRLEANLLGSLDELTKLDPSSYSEIVFVVNPIALDETLGMGASLEAYNILAGKGKDLRVTLLSEARNIYSFYDATNEIVKGGSREIYIQTVPAGKESAGAEELFSIQLYENGTLKAALPLAISMQSNGSFLNSKNLSYRNEAALSNNMLLLSEVLNTGAPELKSFEIGTEGGPRLDGYSPKKAYFPADSFIAKCSR